MEPLDDVTEAPSGSPVKVLETERLLLRRITFEDVDELAEIFADPETTRFLDGPRTREQMREEIGWYLEAYERNGLHFWAAIHKADNRLIGRCGLLLQNVDGREEAEVAYTIARPYWNQGLGTEAARGIKEYIFRNFPFDRLISLVDPENFASQHVAEKNGMHHEKNTEFDGLQFRVYRVDRPEKETDSGG